MRIIEELNKKVAENLESQQRTLQEYIDLVKGLVETNCVVTKNVYGECIHRYIMFDFDRHMSSVRFDWFTTECSKDFTNESWGKIQSVVTYLYGKDHGKTVDKFIDYLVEYAIPHFRSRRSTKDWFCGSVI